MGGFSHCQGSQINPLFTILPKEFTCCLELEESMNSVYRQCRVADNSIGPLEIRLVNGGTFEELMDYAISRGVSINQYKVPRCVNFTPIVELLDSRVISSHFSQSKPHWTPDRQRL